MALHRLVLVAAVPLFLRDDLADVLDNASALADGLPREHAESLNPRRAHLDQRTLDFSSIDARHRGPPFLTALRERSIIVRTRRRSAPAQQIAYDLGGDGDVSRGLPLRTSGQTDPLAGEVFEPGYQTGVEAARSRLYWRLNRPRPLNAATMHD